MLYVIATPIGNLEDITFRALRILKEAGLILAEDTRRTAILLKHYNINDKKVISYNDHNKERKTNLIIKALKEGKNIAIVSDSGTPGISDPGFYLVRECVRNNIKINPIPGANSIITALVCSGLATNKFYFYGFLPKKEKKKIEFFELIKKLDNTIIFFESPYRIKDTLKLMNELLPTHSLVIARELTKKFEEFIRGSVNEIYEMTKDREIKGEIVVLVRRDRKI